MILTELLNDDTLIKHYSDKKVMIKQVETGAVYGEAIDINPCPYTYEETDIVIEEPEVSADDPEKEDPKDPAE